MSKNSFIVIITAPSGSGKTSIYKRVLDKNRNLKFSVSYTTRKKRTVEMPGKDYFFISREQFEAKRERGEFIEWASVHGDLYGTDRKQVENILNHGNICILDVDVQGALNVMKIFPDAVTIFIQPPSLEELEKRLRKRGTESAEEVRTRLQDAKIELEYKKYFNYIIVNEKLESAIMRLNEIIAHENEKEGKNAANL